MLRSAMTCTLRHALDPDRGSGIGAERSRRMPRSSAARAGSSSTRGDRPSTPVPVRRARASSWRSVLARRRTLPAPRGRQVRRGDSRAPAGDLFHMSWRESPLFRLWWQATLSRWHHSVHWSERIGVRVDETATAEMTADFDVDKTIGALERAASSSARSAHGRPGGGRQGPRSRRRGRRVVRRARAALRAGADERALNADGSRGARRPAAGASAGPRPGAAGGVAA
jgi:hypothetical protein